MYFFSSQIVELLSGAQHILTPESDILDCVYSSI